MRLILLLFPFLVAIGLYGQKISGTLTDEQPMPVEFANVILLDADSQYVDARITDEQGFFEFEDIKAGMYRVQASMIGYDDVFSEKINIENNDVTVDLQLQSGITLNEVEIKAKAPLIEQRAGKMVVNVDQNAANMSGNIQELLRKVPGVLVINNNVTLAGGRSVRILIDGRNTDYMDIESVLKDLPAADIEKIEVITQPGAEMDATGTGGVINIILKKNRLQGWNATLSAAYGRARGDRKELSARLNYRKSAFNVYGGLTWQDNFYFNDNSITRTLTDEIYDQYSTIPWSPENISGDIGMDINLSKSHSIGASYKFLDTENDRQNLSQTSILTNPALEEIIRFNTPVDNEGDRNNNRFNTYYQWKVDTSGQKLDFDFIYNNFENKNVATFNSFDENGQIIPQYIGRNNREMGTTDLFVAAMDYDLPLSKTVLLEAGTKLSIARLDNDLQSFLLEDDPRLDEQVSDRFLFDEDIYAGYTKLTYTGKKLEAVLGLRYELSDSRGYSYSTDSTLTREIGQLFPSGSISYPFSKKLGTSLSYSYRIERPNYNSLNSFIAYLDPLTSERGNPFLRPEFTHSLKWSLTFDKQPFFNVEYNQTKDALVQVIEQNESTGEAYSIVVNLDEQLDFKTSLFFPLTFVEGLSGYGGIIYNYTKYDSPYRENQFVRDAHNWTGFLQAAYEIKKDYELNYYAWYTSGGIEGLFTNESMYGMGLGASADFLDGQLNVAVNWDDFINKFWNATINYFDIQGNIRSTWDRNVVRVKVTYKLGNRYLKNKSSRENKASEELDRVEKDN